MKKIIILFIAAMFLMPAASVSAQSVSTGISISNGELQSFYLSVGDYYRVPESRVAYVKQHYHVHDEELPVVFFLASRAHVDPQVIIDLRYRQRMSWLNITFHYGLTPEIYYVPVQRVGPPYGNAYGHYKKHGKDYRKVRLADSDVINLVNLRFMSEYYGVAAEVVMDRRGKGERFVAMNDRYYKEKGKHRDHDDKGKGKDKDDKWDKKEKKDKKDKDDKGKGKGHGKGKDD
ncbi:MAG: hypothetical protein ACM337_09025 [Syntrophaceae bacterium]